MDNGCAWEYGCVSHAGLLRGENEDSLGFFRSGDMVLAIVADGMGGHSSGEVAGRICVQTVSDLFLGAGGGSPENVLRQGFLQADAEILRQSSADRTLRGMGATVVAAILGGEECWFSHLGDSRIYLVETDGAKRLTRDHTVLQDLLDNGLITEKEATGHRMAHVVSKALGHLRAADAVEEPRKITLREGNALLLCSDGLTDLVSDSEISRAVAGREPQQACDDLLELALARGGHDNVTIQVIRKSRGEGIS